MRGKISILSTAELGENLLATASENGVEIAVLPFIEVTPIATKEVLARIETVCRQSITAVFTSVNAVSPVKDICNTDPVWDIYCIGGATKKAIESAFPRSTIVATAASGSNLADEAIENKPSSVVFFCGNIRRDELPNKLKEVNIPVEELVVYSNTPVHRKLERDYDGILFLSPSAVESYFSSNTPANDTVLFAIGNTTADAIKKYGERPLIICASPSKEDLVRTAIDYFNIHLIAK